MITIFEGVLKARQRQNTQITYSAADLHAWLDTLVRGGRASEKRWGRAQKKSETPRPRPHASFFLLPSSNAQPAAGVLVFDSKSQMYSPRALDWLKAETLSFLKKQAAVDIKVTVRGRQRLAYPIKK